MDMHVIDTGFFKLDGGAMFGVVPKSLWQKTNPADSNNLITLAMRCLLIQTGNRLILIDNGIGQKQDDKFLGHYYLHGESTLAQSIHKAGYSEEDITDVFMTHLHFDHCGGGVKGQAGKYELTFKNAQYWSNDAHWTWATVPNPREKASFLKENIMPIKESGQLAMVNTLITSPFPNMDILYVSGHTDHMMIPRIKYKDKTLCFMADLLPTVGHIPLPYVMGYDTRPLITMEEKKSFLEEAADRHYVLFLEHDPVHECCTVKRTEKGIRLDRTFSLQEIL